MRPFVNRLISLSGICANLRNLWIILLLALAGFLRMAPVAAAETLTVPVSEALMRALSDEMERSMKDLVLEGLERPYFIQYAVDDSLTRSLRAKMGALVEDSTSRTRNLGTRVRVGSMDLDNTNVGYPIRPVPLPLDDDYDALRQAVWLVTDAEYKVAVEILARKKAFLQERKIEDRPPDFSPAEPVKHLDEAVSLPFDAGAWRERVAALSARAAAFKRLQDADVSFWAGVSTEYLVNSEGTRLRESDSGILITVSAQVRGAEGMSLSDSAMFLGETFDELPSMEEMFAEVDGMCQSLIAAAEAPMIEHYFGPVLFDASAAGRVFEALLANDLDAEPVSITGFGSDEVMEKKIGTRILPRGFKVYDDPRPSHYEGQLVAGYYNYDDEGVPAQRVNLVEEGVLKTLVSCRAPSRKVKTSNGHGRGRYGDVSPRVACLYFEDEDAVADEKLKAELIQAARDEGLPFGLYVKALGPPGFRSLGSPLLTYKVYVDDGQEELIRGLQFQPVEMRELRDIIASGTKREVYNSMSGAGVQSIIAPAVIFEELELTKVAQQFDALPILKAPASRPEKESDGGKEELRE
ncbi:MAG: hypothetical protein C4547_08070 [Phycisphaerales bacterium]|nr:MAG: hypothetical protein C4547_08070 [Phycisphaerales bacterium]